MVDYTIRYAETEDIQAVAQVYVYTWQAAYKDILPAAFLDSLSPLKWQQSRQEQWEKIRLQSAVVVSSHHIIGVCSLGKSRDDDLADEYGEIYSIYLLPGYWGKGLGSQLLDWATHQLQKQGFNQCMVWTLEHNEIGRRAYERFGFVNDQTTKAIEIGGITAQCVRYVKKI